MQIISTNVQALPNFGQPETQDEAVVLAVLTEDATGLCAAYAAIVPLSTRENVGTQDRIAGNGAKLRYSEALSHFPRLQQCAYRA